MSGVLMGSVHYMGFPFHNHHHELVIHQRVLSGVAGFPVYTFGEKWLYTDLKFLPDEPLDCVVAWDPVWTRKGDVPGSIPELREIRRRADDLGVPVVGIMCDWFSGWVQTHRLGTQKSLELCDAIVVDRAGAAAIRRHGWDGVIVEHKNILTFGNMPTLASGTEEELLSIPDDAPQSHRPIDVAHVGNDHPGLVPLRAYYLDYLREFGTELGWYMKLQNGLSLSNMEALLLQSKVVVNISVGTGLNCRPFEAAAAGCCMVSDGWNIDRSEVRRFSSFFTSPEEMCSQISTLLSSDSQRERLSREAVRFAAGHRPLDVWARTATKAVEAADKWRAVRDARINTMEPIEV
jgi:glycosyl transferase family 1